MRTLEYSKKQIADIHRFFLQFLNFSVKERPIKFRHLLSISDHNHSELDYPLLTTTQPRPLFCICSELDRSRCQSVRGSASQPTSILSPRRVISPPSLAVHQQPRLNLPRQFPLSGIEHVVALLPGVHKLENLV